MRAGAIALSVSIVDLSDADFNEKVKSSSKLVVDCWAPWCGPCKMLAPTLEALARDYSGRVEFAKLNTDQAPKTAMSLSINSIPTLLFFKDGQQIERMTGAHPRENIEAVLKKHFV